MTESVFTWPGMGRLFVDSLGYRDYPVMMGVLVVTAFLVIVCNLFAECSSPSSILAFGSGSRRRLCPLPCTLDTAAATVPAGQPDRRARRALTAPGAWPPPLLPPPAGHRGVDRLLPPHPSAVFAPVIAPRDPLRITILDKFAPPMTKGYLLGADEVGRDLLTRLLYAGRISLLVGFAAMAVTVLVGTVIGLTAGFYGGRVDALLMRLTDALLCFPTVFLLLVLASFVGASLLSITLIIGLTAWMELGAHPPQPDARLARARLRPGGARAGRLQSPADQPPPAAELAGADHGRGDAQHRQRRPGRVVHLLSRLRHPAAGGELGEHAQQRPELLHRRALDRPLPRPADHPHRRRLQLRRRRPARRPRPAERSDRRILGELQLAAP